MHARLKPVDHRFSYKMAALLIDIDKLEEVGKACSLFSVGRFNLLSFYPKDHGSRDGSNLRIQVEKLLEEAGLPSPVRIRLLCYPRVLGYTFNPLSVYFCEDEFGDCVALIYEVKNTFGEQHTYVQPVSPGQKTAAGIRQTARKCFYVSPFLDMEMEYRFRIKPPEDTIALRILESDGDGPILAATFFGRKLPLNSRAIVQTVLQTFGIAWKVIAGIHWEALRLWLKGLKVRPRRPHEKTHSLPGQ